MSKTNEIFEQTAVLVPKSSGMDMSHEVIFSSKCGQLCPVFVAQTLPGDKWSLGALSQIKLPPLATDFFGRVDINLEFFYCPYRLLYGGWEEFITIPKLGHTGGTNGVNFRNPVDNTISRGGSSVISRNPTAAVDSSGSNDNTSFSYANALGIPDVVKPTGFANDVYNILPQLQISGSTAAPGSLLDMLGFMGSNSGTFTTYVYNILPLLAYHKVYSDFYRNSTYENPAFQKPTEAACPGVKYMPYQRYTTAKTFTTADFLADGASLVDFRYRKYADDYFTSATPQPRGLANGSEVTIKTGLGAASDGSAPKNTGFTIPMLRAANSLELFLERAAVTGWKYRDAIRTQWGVTPPDCCETSVYLGRLKAPLYNNTLRQNSNVDSALVNNSTPWGQNVGADVACPSGSLEGSVFDNFECKEHGVILGLFSLSPHCYYSTGTSRMLNCKEVYDWADPLLQNVGSQAIYQWELESLGNTAPAASRYNAVFGYTTPYADWCFMPDRVTGEFRSSGSMEAFALSRGFAPGSAPVIGKSFATISANAMDNVCSTNAELSTYGCFGQIYFDCKAIRPLQKFIIPTLGTPEFMRTQLVSKSGSIIKG